MLFHLIVGLAAAWFVFCEAYVLLNNARLFIQGKVSGIQALGGVIGIAGALAFFAWGGVSVESVPRAFIVAAAVVAIETAIAITAGAIHSSKLSRATAEKQTAEAWRDYAYPGEQQTGAWNQPLWTPSGAVAPYPARKEQ